MVNLARSAAPDSRRGSSEPGTLGLIASAALGLRRAVGRMARYCAGLDGWGGAGGGCVVLGQRLQFEVLETDFGLPATVDLQTDTSELWYRGIRFRVVDQLDAVNL